MILIEAFACFGAGYVSGLSVSSGFIFQGLRGFNKGNWSRSKELLWIVFACLNMLISGLMTPFLIAYVVVGDISNQVDFWPKMSLFLMGVLLGGALVFFGVLQFNKALLKASGSDT